MELEVVEELTYTEITEGIRISVYPEYLPEHSAPEEKLYAHSYTVMIENMSVRPVQLVSRHWYVYSAGALLTEVEGDGVVGEQPELKPGETFQYTSSSVIHDPVGNMHGAYTFSDDLGDSFEVSIPKFDLMYPELIH